jgi:hypothetical protein
MYLSLHKEVRQLRPAHADHGPGAIFHGLQRQ